MAEIFTIDVQLKQNSEKLIIIPEEIKIPVNSIVKWNLVDLNEYYFSMRRFFTQGLIFSLYFPDDSPFNWRKESLRIYGDPRLFSFYPHRKLLFVEDVAEKKGDFKYGIKISDGESNQTLFDEDPYIYVV